MLVSIIQKPLNEWLFVWFIYGFLLRACFYKALLKRALSAAFGIDSHCLGSVNFHLDAGNSFSRQQNSHVGFISFTQKLFTRKYQFKN